MRMVIRGWAFVLIPFSVQVGAVQPLDLQALDQVTAAGVNAQLNWIQREGETVVANGAIAEVSMSSSANLQGAVQNNTSSLNIINIAATDNAQLLNIAVIDDDINLLEQSNYLEQDARFVGRLGRTLSGGPTVFYSYGRGYSNVYSQGYTEGVIQIDRNFSSVYEREDLTAGVPKWNPLQDFTFSLGSWNAGQTAPFDLGFDFIAEVAGVKGGIAAKVEDVVLFGPAIDFGSIRFFGDDVILQPGFFTLPAVDFGTATFEACAVGCIKGSKDLGVVGGGTIMPFSDITLADANPFKDWDLNAGSGIAAIGQGEVTVTGPGAFIDIGLTIDMNEILGPVTDLFDNVISSGPIADGFSEVFGVNISDKLGSLKFPVISLQERVTILDPGPAQTYQIDGDGLCIVFGAPSCELSRVLTLRTTSEQDDTLTEQFERYENTQMEAWEYEETIVFVPGNIDDAQADLIVTTESKLTHIKNNSTLLTDGAQRNLAAMNAVNAANAVIGNSSNFITGSAQAGIRSQSNRFVQYR